MKAFRLGLLGLVLSAGLVTTAYAHDPNINWSIQFGYPGYVEPPAIYYLPAPPVYYVPPPVYYAPRIERRVVVVPQYDYPDYHDNGLHRGWYKHRRHHEDDDD